MKKPPFKVLRQILTDLGFTMTTLPKGHLRFDEPESDTWFVFVPMNDDDPFPMHYLVWVREMLEKRGLMEPEEFEERLRERPLAS